MKKSSPNKLTAARRRQSGDARAFTLTELFVVMGSIAILTAMLLPALAVSNQTVLRRIDCTSNLKQIGIAWSMYSSDFNQLMPCNWPGHCVDDQTGSAAGGDSSPWRTHEIERVVGGTVTMSAGNGWWNLGKEWQNKFITDPRVFYCPAGVPPIVNVNMTYAYYTNPTANPPQSWPTTSAPSDFGDNEIRVAYDYYPQSRAQQLNGGQEQAPVPGTTQGGLDVTKCIVTDQMQGYDDIAHLTDGVGGANALFPDGHVRFENGKTSPTLFNMTSSGNYAWGQTSTPGSIGESTGGTGEITFRHVKNFLPP